MWINKLSFSCKLASFVLGLLILSCNNEKNENFANKISSLDKDIASNRFIKNRSNPNDMTAQVVSIIKDTFKLRQDDTLKFYFRVWEKIGNAKSQNLINIKYINGELKTERIYFVINWKNRNRDDFINNVKRTERLPNSGIKKFTQKMINTDFLQFFDVSKNVEEFAGIEGDYVCLELRVNEKYYFSQFHDPSLNTKGQKILKELSSLIEYFNNEIQ